MIDPVPQQSKEVPKAGPKRVLKKKGQPIFG